MKVLFGIIALFLMFNVEARTSFVSEYISTERGEFFVSRKKATRGAPTFVLVNGLTHTYQSWDHFADQVLKINPNVGIVQFDLRGMGETLKKQMPINYSLNFNDQILDMNSLFKKLRIRGQKYLLGLSYGGGLTIEYARQFEKEFDGYIPIAPYLERLEAHVEWIEEQIRYTRFYYPFNPATDEELYAHFLKVLVYTTFPMAEPLYINNYNLEAVFRMSLGATHFRVADIIDQLPDHKMHMIYALEDEYVSRDKFNELEQSVIKKNRQWASWTGIKYTRHKVPSEKPEVLAKSVFKILDLVKKKQRPLQLAVDPNTETIEILNDKKVYPLTTTSSEEVSCETLFSDH